MKILPSSKSSSAKSEKKAQRILDSASASHPSRQKTDEALSAESSTINECGEALLESFGADFEEPQSRNARRRRAKAQGERQENHRRSKKRQYINTSHNAGANDADSSDENNKFASKNTASHPESEYKYLMHKAIHLLSMREHSVDELMVKLQRKSEDPDTVFAVMEFLKEHDYVSDSRFAEAFVRARANKGQGPTKIKADLKAKGVNSIIIDEYVDPAAARWFDNAVSLYAKKYGDEPVTDYNAWSKRARFLQSRGFTMDQIQATVPQVNYD